MASASQSAARPNTTQPPSRTEKVKCKYKRRGGYSIERQDALEWLVRIRGLKKIEELGHNDSNAPFQFLQLYCEKKNIPWTFVPSVEVDPNTAEPLYAVVSAMQCEDFYGYVGMPDKEVPQFSDDQDQDPLVLRWMVEEGVPRGKITYKTTLQIKSLA